MTDKTFTMQGEYYDAPELKTPDRIVQRVRGLEVTLPAPLSETYTFSWNLEHKYQGDGVWEILPLTSSWRYSIFEIVNEHYDEVNSDASPHVQMAANFVACFYDQAMGTGSSGLATAAELNGMRREYLDKALETKEAEIKAMRDQMRR